MILFVGIFTAQDLVNLCPAYANDVDKAQAFTSLIDADKRLARGSLYSFNLADVQDGCAELHLKPDLGQFTLRCHSKEATAQQTTPLTNKQFAGIQTTPSRSRDGFPSLQDSLVWPDRAESALLKSRFSTVVETSYENEVSASFTPSKLRQELAKETDAFLKRSQLQVERRLAELNRQKQIKLCSSPIRRTETKLQQSVLATSEYLNSPNVEIGSYRQTSRQDDLDFDQENLTPNIKQRMEDLVDLTDLVLHDMQKEGSSNPHLDFNARITYKFPRETKGKLPFEQQGSSRKPLVEDLQRNPRLRSAHTRSKTGL